MDWKLADAKNKFSEVVNLAISEGPQRVVRRNDAVIILCESDYKKFISKRPNFKEYLKSGPNLNLAIERDQSFMREVNL